MATGSQLISSALVVTLMGRDGWQATNCGTGSTCIRSLASGDHISVKILRMWGRSMGRNTPIIANPMERNTKGIRLAVTLVLRYVSIGLSSIGRYVLAQGHGVGLRSASPPRIVVIHILISMIAQPTLTL
jgi:hypothetical protein